MSAYTRYNSCRKPELLDPDTCSIHHYNEAGRITDEYHRLFMEAQRIDNELSVEYKDAYFQLVLHPVKASANLHQLYATVAFNRWFASQRLRIANEAGDKAKQLYMNDSLITGQYHSIANGKWNHMMDQTHIGYTYWQQPPFNKMPEVKYVTDDTASEQYITIRGKRITSEDLIPKTAKGNVFYAKDGYVSIEAEHYTTAVATSPIRWEVIPNLGRTLSAVTPFPVTAKAQTPGGNSSRLEYLFYLSDSGTVNVNAYLSPTGPFHNKENINHYIMTRIKIYISVLCIALTAATVSPSNKMQTSPTLGLKDYYSKYFNIGVAANMNSLRGADSALLVKEFNSVTPENDLKIGPVHPAENQYNWRAGDAIVAFAQRNNLKIRGHNLVWHYASQTPTWIFKDKDGSQASKELVLQRLKDHITTVVSRYKGKIYAWDVANEVISDKHDEYLRQSDWYKICGEDYIAKAFQWAHEADPDALLFYNDYNEISPVKREKIYKLVKGLKDAGVPIHGIGLQAHWAINEPTRGQLDSTLKRFSDLGLQIHITELDISVYSKEHDARERKAEDQKTDFTAEKENAQLEKYKMCFELFKKYSKAITSVTFWNLSDKYSWLDNFPVRNRKDYPLLFDQNLQPKKAYWEVVKIAN